MNVAPALLEASTTLRSAVGRLTFSPPVTTVYNPLCYAWAGWSAYVTRFAGPTIHTVFLGMNPGPWGMAQVGVPFGEIESVRNWMGIEVPIERPRNQHPKRPVDGFSCARSEVSGKRLWGLMRERFGDPERFFAEHFVGNYCPLVFMAESGRNITPDKLPNEEQRELFAACDQHVVRMVEILSPRFVVGVGRFAEKRAIAALERLPKAIRPTVGTMLHPSPASPAANRGWAEQASAQLTELGVWR